MILYIDRLEWIRGTNAQTTYLLTPDGHRCCFGILGRACGIEDADLLGEGAPPDIPRAAVSKWPSWVIAPGPQNTPATLSLIRLNDASRYESSSIAREVEMSRQFARQGVNVVFFN